MAILKRDEFFSRVESIIGNSTSDESITFLEDMTDTYNDLESKVSESGSSEWEQKYKELDETWKKRYQHRFFSGDNRNIPGCIDTGVDSEPEYDPESITIESLFKKKG